MSPDTLSKTGPIKKFHDASTTHADRSRRQRDLRLGVCTGCVSLYLQRSCISESECCATCMCTMPGRTKASIRCSACHPELLHPSLRPGLGHTVKKDQARQHSGASTCLESATNNTCRQWVQQTVRCQRFQTKLRSTHTKVQWSDPVHEDMKKPWHKFL